MCVIDQNFPRPGMKVSSHTMFMEITIRLPRGRPTTPLYIKRFTLGLTYLDLVVDNLDTGLISGEVQFFTYHAMMDIKVSAVRCRSPSLGAISSVCRFGSWTILSTVQQSIVARDAIITYEEGPVRGSFNLSSSLRVYASNAPVEINAALVASPRDPDQCSRASYPLCWQNPQYKNASNRLWVRTQNGCVVFSRRH